MKKKLNKRFESVSSTMEQYIPCSNCYGQTYCYCAGNTWNVQENSEYGNGIDHQTFPLIR